MIEKLGIAHVLGIGASVIHSAITSQKSLGRIVDVTAAWCSKETENKTSDLGELKVLILALLDFVSADSKGLGRFEAGMKGSAFVTAIRFESPVKLEVMNIQNEITQIWLNSEKVKLFKRVLSPHDRVEVRYHPVLNLIEWRVYRALHLSEVVDYDSSFKILIDASESLSGGEAVYKDLGDLPFHSWIEEAYQNRSTSSRSGDIRVEGAPSQEETDWASAVVQREEAEIDQQVSRFSENLSESEVSYQLTSGDSASTEGESENSYSEEKIRELLAEQQDLKGVIKDFVFGLKQKELRSGREVNALRRKMKEIEALLRRKELVNQRNQTEIKTLQEKLEEERKKKKHEKSDHFRIKALEMYEKLKRVMEENTTLEKMMIELRQRERNAPERVGDIVPAKPLEDFSKKLDRAVRALEAEKTKVKSLSERVTMAEKEAQSAGPLLQDLESKVEHTLKTAQQHKKETEAVKQKLVQSEAEKNKIKNELVKAQAQIQTLMKRQAS